MSVGLAREKTGAAGALAHAIVIHLQWAGTNLILLRLTGVDGCTDSIDRKRGGGHHPGADCLPNRARRPRRSKAFHGGIGLETVSAGPHHQHGGLVGDGRAKRR
jgi:hypothetical protein